MSSTRKRIAIIASVVVLIAGLALIALDRAWQRFVVEAVFASSGRQLTIGGDSGIDFFPWPPRVRAEQVSFANAPWGTAPTMLDIEILEFTIEVLPLLRGRWVAPEVILTNPKVVLERSADGRRNWILSPDQSGSAAGPRIVRLVVNGGSLLYRDPTANTELVVGVATNPAGATPGAATTFDVQGRFRAVPVSAAGTGGEVLALGDSSMPLPIAARFELGGVRGTIDGTITGLSSLNAFDVALTLSGKDLARLAPLVDVPLNMPSFKVAARLSLHEQQWRLSSFEANIGESNLAGAMQINLAGKVPTFDGKLSSTLIDADLLRRWFDPGSAAKSAATNGDGWTAQLRGANGQVQFAVKRVRDAPIPIDNMAGTLQLRDGVATIDALSLGVAGGKITSTVRVDTTRTPAAAQVSARIEHLALNRLLPSRLLAQGDGRLGGQLKLALQGNAFDSMLASAGGSAQFAVTGGEIDARLIKALRLDAADVLRFAFGTRSQVKVNCAFADFKIANGTLNTHATVIDTPKATALVTGSIDVAGQTLDLQIKPVAAGFRLFSAPRPVAITGTFAKPTIRVDNSVYLRGGAAVLLGLINPLAALLPMISVGNDQGDQCVDLLARAQLAAPSK